MFEFMQEDDRGQVGIGTLIVFIAMVLVAAIAAGVLINTAGFLQSQAEATGEESTDLVSERIDVTSTVGIVADPDGADDGELEEIRVSVSGSAGADQIDLSETTIQAVGPEGQENLVFVDNTDGDVSDLEEGEFAVKDRSTGDFVDEAVLSDEDDYMIVLNPEVGPFGHTEEDGTVTEVFGESDTASLDIVSPSGATTSVELRAPDLFSDDGEAVRL